MAPTKRSYQNRHKLKPILVGLGVILSLWVSVPAGATSANISHSYASRQSIRNGSLVSLDPNHSNNVEAANTDNGQQILGVAVDSDDSLIALDAQSGAVQIATSGTVNTLVSTLAGPIKVGDQIAVSTFNGVGAKAAFGEHVIGLAQTAFNAHSKGASPTTITDKQGHKHMIAVGFVRLSIGVGTGTQATGPHINSLQSAVRSLTGHTISTLRILISLLVALVALTAAIILTYTSVYSGIISIGRNPLAKYAVYRGLAGVFAMMLLMAVIAGGAIFILLR